MASMSHFQTQNCNQYDSFEITSKCFWKKENLVKVKKEQSDDIVLKSYLCLKNDIPGW